MYILKLFCLFSGYIYSKASVNLALRRPTIQSSVFQIHNQNLSSNRAVDGKYDLNVNNLSCAVTKGNALEVFWRVTLDQISIISHIHFVFENTKQIVSILRNHEVYVSFSPMVKTGSLCYKETREHPSSLTNEVYCLSQGRYVTYYTNHLYDNKVALLLLCEVEVYGCPMGFYGPECSDRCSTNCRNQPCEPDFGRCIGGCHPGFTTDQCNNECDIGWYGNGCALTCSPTCLNNDCFNTNGTCKQCVPGATGDMCEINNGTVNTDTNPTVPNEGLMNETLSARNNGKYLIAIGVLGLALLVLIIMLLCYRLRYKKMEKLIVVTNISSPTVTKYPNPEDDPSYHTSDQRQFYPPSGHPLTEQNHSTTRSNTVHIYDSPSTDSNDKNYNAVDGKGNTLSYANAKFGKDPGLDYEALRREGIFPRESHHIYDPLHS